MKRVGILAVVVALGALSISAWGVSLCEYRSPMTSLVDARATFGYRYYDDAATPVIDVNSGRLALGYDQLYDTPGYGFTINGSAEVALDDFTPTGWLGQGAGTFRFYPMEESLLFAFGGVAASMATGQPQVGVEVRLGAGLGRFTDVTPLAKAVSIESVVGALPDDVLMGIADVIGRAIEFETVKDLVSAIENLAEGVLGEELDALQLLTIEEIYLATGDERKCGWAIQGGIGYELIDPYGGAQNVVVAASADAAFAFAPEDQLLFHASFSGPFDIMNENTLTANLSYERLLSEDSTVIADYSLQRVKPAGQPTSTNHTAGLSVGFDIRGIDIGLTIALTRESADPGWSIDVSVSAMMDLL